MKKLRHRLNTIYYCIKMGLGIKYWFKKPVDIPKPEPFSRGVQLGTPMLMLLVAQYAAAAKTITRHSGQAVYGAESTWLNLNFSTDKIIYLDNYQLYTVISFFKQTARGECKFCKKDFKKVYEEEISEWVQR